ncbi:hypothetical protein CDAR_294011 [Caerostris darwini]|uniref:Uncharacterized protein n=1 Tax=Caerostris darwini TaxID=1538125 RepID=A0AAV4VFK4_9ARAC|nr:hypothetical protein CDAR_294011 [Caerostris darwini]
MQIRLKLSFPLVITDSELFRLRLLTLLKTLSAKFAKWVTQVKYCCVPLMHVLHPKQRETSAAHCSLWRELRLNTGEIGLLFYVIAGKTKWIINDFMITKLVG